MKQTEAQAVSVRQEQSKKGSYEPFFNAEIRIQNAE